jgi:hypothetical protein
MQSPLLLVALFPLTSGIFARLTGRSFRVAALLMLLATLILLWLGHGFASAARLSNLTYGLFAAASVVSVQLSPRASPSISVSDPRVSSFLFEVYRISGGDITRTIDWKDVSMILNYKFGIGKKIFKFLCHQRLVRPVGLGWMAITDVGVAAVVQALGEGEAATQTAAPTA